MLSPGPAKKVTIHLNEDTSASHDFLYNEILSFLYDRGIAGAALIRPAAGFGSHHRMHRAGANSVAGEHLPVRIEFVERPDTVDAIMPQLSALITDGLIEVQDTIVIKSASREELI